jgi:hypothetical protein
MSFTFHNNPDIKAAWAEHIMARLADGSLNNRSVSECFVSHSIDEPVVSTEAYGSFEKKTGISSTMAMLIESISLGLDGHKFAEFIKEIVTCLPIGIDSDDLIPPFMVWLLEKAKIHTSKVNNDREFTEAMIAMYMTGRPREYNMTQELQKIIKSHIPVVTPSAGWWFGEDGFNIWLASQQAGLEDASFSAPVQPVASFESQAEKLIEILKSQTH